ncbi:MAG: ribosomal protein S18-alanine N-acetyltransferase [Christensenellaceae bacterium]|jgi:ribosomal-protein-alanine N-acetyltransferase|nr:ribosomal protein S18-alanine N-acetyltransferase [Christensenellaceae bacterium]
MKYFNMTLDDISDISKIEKDAFPYAAWSESTLRAELESPTKHYIVMRDNNRVIAYAGFEQILDEGHIMTIAVESEQRNKGIGREMLNELINIMRELGLNAATLEVKHDNYPAIALYQKCGFLLAGTRPNYYAKGVHALIFWLYF